ncbi:MAG: hypothetical protein QME62_03865 [Armatimonadota bacterium]|nr:hypothetical protein [Armatimonadota bacterium]
MAFTMKNKYAIFSIGADAKSVRLVDKRTGKDYSAQQTAFAYIRMAGKVYGARAISSANGRIAIKFGDSGIRAVLRAESKERYFTLEVESLSGKADEFTFIDVQLTPSFKGKDPLAACAMALNLKTNVLEIPGANTRLRAMCYSKFGFEGAKIAIVACPFSEMRSIMQEVVLASEDLPHSNLGGPWALDQEINRGSYIFNFDGITEETVDDWIALAKTYGMTQIDFHGGSSFRFGDCRPNPQRYPNGRASLKAVIDKLHSAGLKVGLHPYAFFIAKDCPWVTPVPDSRLAKDATFTLAKDIAEDATTIPVLESTEKMSATTGFFVRNSVTLQIDDELVTYSGVSKELPYSFTGCKRGAYGTKVSAHKKGAKVHHLKECFFLFAPDGESTLLTEVAEAIADTFNECGFDMMYLDALDGEDVLGGAEYGWHYGSKFVFEICKRLKKPALMEMSTFRHHLWYVRSRIGAWDHPTRSHKRFIDLHCLDNEKGKRMFMPVHLGWWHVITGEGPNVIQNERTYPDDIEYLLCKAMGYDASLSLTGFGPATPGYQRLATLFRNYENLRHAGYFSEAVKEKLRELGKEFTLERSGEKWRFRQMNYDVHKVDSEHTAKWKVTNPFSKQPLRLRIEALYSAANYDSSEGIVIADFSNPSDFPEYEAAQNVVANISATTDQVAGGKSSAVFTAKSTLTGRTGSWAKFGKTLEADLNIADKQALGVWVYGDGQGEILNLQLLSPPHMVAGIADHYIKVDFKGWRYFELIESEGGNIDNYSWPYNAGTAEHGYGHLYKVYRESVDYGHIGSISLWCNNLPPGKSVRCLLSPVKALPLIKAKIRNPSITIDGKTIVFPVEMESGSWLEFNSLDDCKLYAPNGELIQEVRLQGDIPEMSAGDNEVKFECEVSPNVTPRAKVTIISRGNLLGD